MKKLLTLVLILTLSPAQAQKIPYDYVTYETVRQYCKEHHVRYDNWLRVYNNRVRSGAGVIYPRTGNIYTRKGDTQQLANMLSFYTEIRHDKGHTLVSINEKFLVFNLQKIATPTPLPTYRRYQFGQ